METLNNAMNSLLDQIALDYADWHARSEYGNEGDYDKMRGQLSVEEGRKYLKVIRTDNQKTVWGFIQKEDDKKFRAGDILKAASWAAPARNKPRGNVLEGGYNIRWTGPNYL